MSSRRPCESIRRVMREPVEHKSPAPFWPRHSPHFVACRRAVRPFTGQAVIGLSGGPDSLALVAAAAAEGKRVRALVVDHGLQDGSAQVAHRAAHQARSLGVSAEVVRVEIDPATATRSGVEAAAREARYGALARAAGASGGEAGASDIWVAHTLDDQAETLLLGALRGNPAGMAAVELVPTQPAQPALPTLPDSPAQPALPGCRLVRPLLTVRRADTTGACSELGLEWWDDPMNHDPSYRRVAIRHTIIPALTDLLGGDAAVPLAGTADRVAADRQLVETLVDISSTDNCAELAAEDAAVRRRRIAAWLRENNAPIQRDQLTAIEHLVTNWHGQGPITLAGGRTVTRRGGQLEIE